MLNKFIQLILSGIAIGLVALGFVLRGGERPLRAALLLSVKST